MEIGRNDPLHNQHLGRHSHQLRDPTIALRHHDLIEDNPFRSRLNLPDRGQDDEHPLD